MNFAEWIDPSFSLRFSTALLHFLWQGCVVGALVFLVTPILKRAPTQWRYVFNVSALLLIAACLPATFLLLEIPPAESLATIEAPLEYQPATFAELPVVHGHLDNAVIGETPSSNATSAATVGISDPQPLDGPADSTLLIELSPIAPWLTAIYLFGVALMLARLATGVRGGHRLRQSAVPIEDATLLDMLGHQSRQIGLRTVPAIAWCEQISIPVVIGIVKPVVLLPAALAAGLSPDQMQAVITHELAHIRRFDLLVNMIQRLIEAVLFFHPVVWFVSRRISVEREHAADDMVLTTGWRPPHYADALLRMAELSSTLRNTGIAHRAATLAASGTGATDFKRRIMRLIGDADAAPVRLTRGGLAVLSILVLMSLSAPIAMHALAQSSAADQVADDSEEATATPDDPQSAEGNEVPERTSIDKSRLPIVAASFQHSTTVLGGLVSGGGIIERIEDDVVYFRSGDNIEIARQTDVFSPGSGDEPPRMVKADVLEAGMAVSYSMRDGRIERLILVGIVEVPPSAPTVFDTIADLELRRGNEVNDSIDGRFPLRLTGKDGEVSISIGETKLIELPEPTLMVEWRNGDYRPESIDDFEPFDYLLVQWRGNGRITWTCYQSPDIAAEDDPAESPEDQRSEIRELQRELEQIQSLETAADGEADSGKRSDLLRQAVEAYAVFHNRHRSQLAGLWARFCQARCLQKLGDDEGAEEILEDLPGVPGDGDGIRRLREGVDELLGGTVNPGEAGGTGLLAVPNIGTRFVYVIDNSWSMANDKAMQAAMMELTDSLQRLDESQQFQIIFYNSEGVDVMRPQDSHSDLFRGTDAQRLEAARQYSSIQPHGGTDHFPALRRALEFDPDAIFFLTDGSDPHLTAGERAALQQASPGTRIHCIEFGRGAAVDDLSDWLQRLARESGGTYVYADLDLPSDELSLNDGDQKNAETDLELQAIQTLRQLGATEATATSVDISDVVVTDEDLVVLAQLPRLRRLVLMDEPVTDDGRVVSTVLTDEALKHLAALEHLESLDVNYLPVTDMGLKELADLRNLRHLGLRSTEITDASWQQLSNYSQLDSLDLRATDITDVFLNQLVILPRLTYLDISSTHVTDEGLVNLPRFPELSRLRIGGRQITDDGMTHILSIRALSELSLYGTQVTDKGLVRISDLDMLSYLVLQGLMITDDALEFVAACENLKHFTLSATRITDDGIEHLHELKSVERMFLSVPGVTPEAIDALKQAFPEARIRRIN